MSDPNTATTVAAAAGWPTQPDVETFGFGDCMAALRIAIALAASLVMASCAAPPAQLGSGAVACARVETLTTQTTTVYIAAGQGGTIMVQPNCTMAVQLTPPGQGI